MYLLLQQVPLSQLGDALGHASPLPILGIAATIVLALLPRAARWGVYFLPRRSPPFGPLFSTLSISYMASTLLPFRAGELIRAVFLGQREAVPVAEVVGTIVLEKLFDFLAVGVILAALLLTTPLPPEALVAVRFVAAAILGGFGVVVALALWREPTLRLFGRVDARLPVAVTRRLSLRRAATQFASGTDCLRSPRLWVAILGWTALAWVLALVTVWLGGQALGIPLGLAQVAFLVAVTSTGQAVPSSPGYVGVYHAAAVLALTALGIDTTSALAIAVVTHAFTYGTLVVTGLAALWLGGYGLNDMVAVTRQRQKAASATAPS